MTYQERLYKNLNDSEPIITMSKGEVEVNLKGIQISIKDYEEDARQGFVKNPSKVRYAVTFPKKEKREIQKRLSKLEI